jgi:hypothetical protein
MARARLPARIIYFSLVNSPTRLWVNPTSYPMGTIDFLLGVKRSDTYIPKYVFVVWCLIKHRDISYLISLAEDR